MKSYLGNFTLLFSFILGNLIEESAIFPSARNSLLSCSSNLLPHEQDQLVTNPTQHTHWRHLRSTGSCLRGECLHKHLIDLPGMYLNSWQLQLPTIHDKLFWLPFKCFPMLWPQKHRSSRLSIRHYFPRWLKFLTIKFGGSWLAFSRVFLSSAAKSFLCLTFLFIWLNWNATSIYKYYESKIISL